MIRNKMFIGFLAVSLFLSGCGNVQQDGARALESPDNRQSNILQDGTTDQNLSLIVDGQNTGNIRAIRQADETYIPLNALFETLGYTVTETENGRIQIGYTDPIYTITEDSTRAVVDEQPVELPHAVTTIGNQTYATIPTLEALLRTSYGVEWTAVSLNITPGPSLFPQDDGWDHFEADDGAVATVTQAQANRIISHGKRYLGVKYVFGAQTGRTSSFDCSSYTQYLYGQQGIRLPRTARAQATRGTYVRVSELKPGDLLFFSVPGRFRNDRTVGHVGIYMGNGRMINAVPPRVQITNVANSRYWKRVYLGARRVG